jgi:UDP-galactopyranose mutase
VKVLVVGAGFAGAAVARVLKDNGVDVTVIDERLHPGGTAHDFVDADGILRSTHGAHLFHTNAQHIVDFLSRFTEWRPHEHRVLADVHGQHVPVPINRTTVNRLFDLNALEDRQVEDFFEQEREKLDRVLNSEQQVVGKVGRRLFDLIYRDYTLKQWGRPAAELSSQVAGRIPIRTNRDDRYFTDRFQAQPAGGWAPLFERMLDGIDVKLGIAFRPVYDVPGYYDRIVYTGPIDEFFHHDLGVLPFRSVRFEHQNFPGTRLRLPVGVINYCGPEPYTRRIEWRHFTGQVHDSSTITTEFPDEDGEPHYPVPCLEAWGLHHAYRELAKERPDVVFSGRLGSYRYMTMDQTVGQALKLGRQLISR